MSSHRENDEGSESLSAMVYCRECHGSGCRDCAWFGTEEARVSYERAHRIVSDLRRRRVQDGRGSSLL